MCIFDMCEGNLDGVRNCFFLNFLFCPFSLPFETFWSWKLPFQRYLHHFWVRTSLFPWNLQHLGTICNILELETAISTVYLHHFWVRTSLFPWNLQHFGTICNILELETAISTVYLQHFWKFATLRCSNCSCNMLVGNWVHVGLVLGLAFFYLFFLVRVGLKFFSALDLKLGFV